MESRYARDPLPSQIFIPAAERGREEVEPDMNQRSSVKTARRNTRFVVRRGRIGVPVGDVRENFKGAGAKREMVPVPVLFVFFRQLSILLGIIMIVQNKNWILPVRTMFTGL